MCLFAGSWHIKKPIILVLSVIFLSACHSTDNRQPTIPLVFINVNTSNQDYIYAEGFNAYAVRVTPGVIYKISITNPNDDLDLFYSADRSFNWYGACIVDNQEFNGPVPEDCIAVAPADGFLYFAVDGLYMALTTASYTITVEEVVEDTLLPQTSMNDFTTRTGAVLYTVPLTTGSDYTAALTEMNNDAELYVRNNAFGAISCDPDNTGRVGTSPEDCTFRATNNTAYIIADGLYSTAQIVQYTVSLIPR